MARIPYWNISYGVIIDLLAIPVFLIFVYGLYLQWQLIKKGQLRVIPSITKVFQGIGTFRPGAFFMRGILNPKIYRKPASGVAHGCVFWGMALLFVGTNLVILNILFGLPVFTGAFNRWFMSFTLDLAGLLVLGGIVFFLLRRQFMPDRLKIPEARTGFVLVSSLLGVLIITGFVIEGARLCANTPEAGAFVGNFLAASVISQTSALQIHTMTWWVHGLLALFFVAYIPFSPLVHIILAPVNSGFADPSPGVKMGVMDFSAFDDEDAEELPALGADKLADFTRKRFLDFASCLWCGRCQEACPAHNTQKPLSPKGVIVTLAQKLAAGEMEDSVMETLSMEAIFNCTTCAACMEVCPVSINQPKTIMRFRQNLVMEQGQMPELMGKAITSLEQRSHPFFGTGSGAAEWRKDLEVPKFEAGKTEYLLWIGCSITYEQRAWTIGRAMVNILKSAHVSFGILEDSRCTGDPAKQMGNEFLFAEIAQQNIDDFSALGIQKIITMCPHCYNSFTRHYPKMGGQYEVIPHASFIRTLVDDKKLQLDRNAQTITYHDPCYLGRRNGVYDDPRNVIASVGNLVEMPRNKNESFCCGGGGGNYWAEETGTRINQARAGEALGTDADAIAVACPFCLLMLTDGVKKYTEEIKAFDIAEIVEKCLPDMAEG
ncbi:heterodisulfide reductase-related iron-sulfur binding cluster [Desulfobacula sp.]|uniref:heterodisulfide reductase-related iron-sulfur binding cluster n=1 Tax=Desulfobacula sp. TaxID=2593537 RepID=UPI00260F6EDF|nr:heterodisulfide reductase-related iron-sulfur binding cluster [Desulfobacula sp.]